MIDVTGGDARHTVPVSPSEVVERRTTYREVLAEREFAALLLAWLVSMLGNVLAHVALSYLVFSRTGSPLLAAVAFSIGWVPHLFVSTVAAGLPDRVPARRLMVACELVSAVLVALLVVPGLPVGALLALTALQGCALPVFSAARAASLPDLLPGDRYVVGKALLSLVAQSSQLVGYALGAALLVVLSPSGALLLDAGSFLVSAVLLRLGLADRGPHRGAGGSLVRDSLHGVRAVLAHPRLRALLLLGWLPPMLGVVPEALAVPYAALVGAGASGAGVLLGSVALGVIVGELVTARLLRPAQRVAVMAPLALSISLPPLLFVLRPGLWLAAALLVLSGVGWAYGLPRSALLLAALPGDLRARGLSLDSSGAMLTQALGFVLAGAAAELLAPPEGHRAGRRGRPAGDRAVPAGRERVAGGGAPVTAAAVAGRGRACRTPATACTSPSASPGPAPGPCTSARSTTARCPRAPSRRTRSAPPRTSARSRQAWGWSCRG